MCHKTNLSGNKHVSGSLVSRNSWQLIMIINIISDSGLVTFLRLLFLADTFLQHFLQIFSQIFLQHFLWWHFNYEFFVAITILFVYSFKSDADGEKDLKRIRNTVLRC